MAPAPIESLIALVEETDAGTFGNVYKGSSLETAVGRGVASLNVPYLSHGELERQREQIARFGEGVKASVQCRASFRPPHPFRALFVSL